MAPQEYKLDKPLLVIVGPTASGKTALAVRLAKAYGGEVISADSRAIYRGLSIGTAKPTIEEREGIPHWGIDLVDPNERFTAADFKRYAVEKIAEVRARGKMPILVGGTGLYIDAVVYDFEFNLSNDQLVLRDELMKKSLNELYMHCNKNNVLLPENKKNKRHVVSAIIRNGESSKRKSELEPNTIVVGIATKSEKLRSRIAARAEAIIHDGAVAEAQAIANEYGWDSEAMTANIYPLIKDYLSGKLTESEMTEWSITRDWQLAKRQMTWFKRDKHIYWDELQTLYTYIARQLDELNNL